VYYTLGWEHGDNQDTALRTALRSGGLLGFASAVLLAVLPPSVDPTRYSYPLDATTHSFIQAWFAIQNVGLLLGLLGLRSSGAAGSGRVAPAGYIASLAGMGLLIVNELLAITLANATTPSTPVSLLEASYGVASLLIGAGLVAVGIAVLREHHWRGPRRFLPLATGAYVFVGLVPALSFSFVVARLAIVVWMLLFAAVGWTLWRAQRTQDAAAPVGLLRRG
jgi:hypothetical protein